MVQLVPAPLKPAESNVIDQGGTSIADNVMGESPSAISSKYNCKNELFVRSNVRNASIIFFLRIIFAYNVNQGSVVMPSNLIEQRLVVSS